jgi:hypothetical protein
MRCCLPTRRPRPEHVAGFPVAQPDGLLIADVFHRVQEPMTHARPSWSSPSGRFTTLRPGQPTSRSGWPAELDPQREVVGDPPRQLQPAGGGDEPIGKVEHPRILVLQRQGRHAGGVSEPGDLIVEVPMIGRGRRIWIIEDGAGNVTDRPLVHGPCLASAHHECHARSSRVVMSASPR